MTTSASVAHTKTDPVQDYLATFDRLRARKRWTEQTVTFRFVALSLGAVGLDIDYELLNTTASGLRKRARWSSPLKSEIRYVVAAMILRRRLDPAFIHACVIETRDAFKEFRIPSRGKGPTFAALLLALHSEGDPVSADILERLADIYRRWRKDHALLTNANDLPTAALHACGEKPVDVLTAEIAQAYAQLHEAGFRRGNALQLVSHLLAADPRGTDIALQRFQQVAASLKEAGERTGQGRYDEMALLALTRESPDVVTARVLDYRERLRQAKPRPAADLAFSLAAGMELAEDSQRALENSTGDLAALQSLRVILDAQQAATMAAISGGAAAGAAAGAST